MTHDPEGQARADFERAFRRAWLHGLLAPLTRERNDLISYDEARRRVIPEGESDRGLHEVPVERIVGSTDRAQDYDRDFRPRRRHASERWRSVARAAHAGTVLPPVRLRQIGDDYFVVDGHHRVSVARALGQGFVDAEVVELRGRAVGAATRPPLGRNRRRGLACAPRSASASPLGAAQECAA